MGILSYHYHLLIGAIAMYLVANINFAFIFVKKFKHADIRTLGSGNPGTTNVVRNFGLKLGALTFLCDTCKGVIAAVLGRYVLFAITGDYEVAVFAGYFFSLCAVIGHIFPVFLNFRGGKGVATSLGAFAVIHPLFTLCAVAGGIIIILTTDRVSVFALIHMVAQTIYTAIVVFSDTALVVTEQIGAFACILIMSTIVYIAHRANIVRLIKGEEKGMGVKKLFTKKTEISE